MFHGVNGYDARSAGTEDKARVKATSGHIGWSDLIFVMEKKHVRRLQESFRDILSHKKIVCLNIPDNYQFMNSELIELLISSETRGLEDEDIKRFERAAKAQKDAIGIDSIRPCPVCGCNTLMVYRDEDYEYDDPENGIITAAWEFTWRASCFVVHLK